MRFIALCEIYANILLGILEEDEPLPRVNKRPKKGKLSIHRVCSLADFIGDYYDDDQASGDLSGVASGTWTSGVF